MELDKSHHLLSKREQEVLQLISEGFQNKSIAKKLSISVKTVEFHKENLKHKLGTPTIKDLYDLCSNDIDTTVR